MSEITSQTAEPASPLPWERRRHTAVLALADGTVLSGEGAGATGEAVGEVCFNTAMTGYQEILTDPSYAGQIITFTFPHIGIVGANDEDIETVSPAAAAGVRGALFRAPITAASNYRAKSDLDAWLAMRGIIALTGIDTRALTARIRETGMPHGVIAHDPAGHFDLVRLIAEAGAWAGIEGNEMARSVTTTQTLSFQGTPWEWGEGYGRLTRPRFHVVVVDFGTKGTLLRELARVGARSTVVTATASAADILAHKPDGVVLSNGPGDPAATAQYAAPMIRGVIEAGVPLFGICLGHQLLALAIGGATRKMAQGHHGANHPVVDRATGKVEITSMNHGFTVDRESLPVGAEETHVSLFDGSNCGVRLAGRPVFSVQHHPEASPGPKDSRYLFARFADMMAARRAG